MAVPSLVAGQRQPPPRPQRITALYRPECSQLFVLFQGGAGPNAEPTSFLGESGLIDRNLVLIRDDGLSWFHKNIAENIPDMEALAAYIGRIRGLMQAQELYLSGVCMGGWASLYLGHRLGADGVWAFGPLPPERKIRAGLEAQGVQVEELPQLLARHNGKTKYRIYYCEHWKERGFSMAFRRCPGVAVRPVRGNTPLTLSAMKQQGMIKGLFPPRRIRETPSVDRPLLATG